MGTTAKGVPFADDSDLVTDWPTQDEAQAEWIDDHPGVSILTTAERDALSGGEEWTGRLIYNTTTTQLERYTGSAWVGVLDYDHTSAAADGDILTSNGGYPDWQPPQDTISLRPHEFVVIAGSPAQSTINRWPVWLLDASAAAETLNASLTFTPPHWPVTGFHVVLWWTNAGAGSGNVRWTVDLAQVADGAAIASPAAVVVDTVAAPAQNVLEATILNVPDELLDDGKIATLSVSRLGSHVDDTLANDVALLRVDVVRDVIAEI